jgi:peptide/nickel transport system substrate-binding protein
MGFKDEWWQYFNTMDCTNWEITKPCSAGYPALWAWLKVKTSDEILEFKRNPYYFKVDNTGQQLPYIDRVISQQVNDTEAVNLKVLAGEIDLLREDTALIKMPLYREAEDKGLIKTHLLDMHVNPTVLFFNFTLQDENDRKVLNNLKFRQALNYAMNREEILENVYFGFGAMPEHLYKGHNPEKAEELLDSIGMTRGANGWRVGPNGKTFEYRFEYGDYAPDIKFVIELLTQHFEAVGIKTTSKMLESTLMNVTGENNERKHSSVLWVHKPLWVSGGWNDHLPSTGGTGYANLWRKWYDSNGKEGEEPPQKMKDLMEITRKRGSYVPYSEEDTKAYNGLMKNLADNLWMLNIVDKVNYVLITNPKMGNVQQSGQAIAADNSGEQMYYK